MADPTPNPKTPTRPQTADQRPVDRRPRPPETATNQRRETADIRPERR